MKELYEPSVKRTQFTFFRQFSLRWTPPSQFQELISWLTYVGPPQSGSTDDILADLC